MDGLVGVQLREQSAEVKEEEGGRRIQTGDGGEPVSLLGVLENGHQGFTYQNRPGIY